MTFGCLGSWPNQNVKVPIHLTGEMGQNHRGRVHLRDDRRTGHAVPWPELGAIIDRRGEELAVKINPVLVAERLRRRGMSYAQKCLTWEAKARSVTSVLRWVLQQGPKPDLTPATMLQAGTEADVEIPARS